MPGSFVTEGGGLVTFFGVPLTEGGDPLGPLWAGPFQAGIEPGPEWVWSIGPGASSASPGPVRQLTAATGRVLTRRVKGHGFAQFSIDGRHDEALTIVERETDLWCYRDGDLMFRGRIVGGTDDVGGTHRCQFTAVDYRGMLALAAKVEPPVPTYTAVDQGLIPWDLISDWQALDGGDYGITNGLGAVSGVTRDETDIAAGAPIAEVIDRIAERDGGFEWEISETLELNRWYPQRGSDNEVVLGFGGLLFAVSSNAVGEFGNVGLATGNDTTTPAVFEHATLATDQRGRWTRSQGYSSVSIQGTVDAKAEWLAATGVTEERIWRAVLGPRKWGGRDHIWLGDTVRLEVDSGRIQIPGVDHRVVELQVVVGDNGEEIVSAGLVGIEGSLMPGARAPLNPAVEFAQTLAGMRADIADLKRAASL